MEQMSFLDYPLSKGFGYGSRVYEIYSDFMLTFTSYEMSYNYVFNTAAKEIEQAIEPGEHLLLEPLILPSISNAIFTAMYGEFEGYLKSLCKAIGTSINSKIKLNDLSGQGIEQCSVYFTKVLDNDSLKQSKEWNRLKDWNRVRNIIVHNNSQVRDGNEGEKDISAIRNLALGYNEKRNKVYLSKENCEDFQITIINFMKKCLNY